MEDLKARPCSVSLVIDDDGTDCHYEFTGELKPDVAGLCSGVLGRLVKDGVINSATVAAAILVAIGDAENAPPLVEANRKETE